MYNPLTIQKDFDRAAPAYDQHATLQQHVLLQLVARMPRIAPTACILDAGCGTGHFVRHTRLGNIVALDCAYGMCALAQAASTAVNADMNRLPFAGNSFDMVFSSLALQWAGDWKATLREWKRVVKPGGYITFSTFGDGTLHELAESFRQMDNHSHVSSFISAEDIWQQMDATVERETINEYYPDIFSLGRHLKVLGARNKHVNAKRSLTTPRQMERVQEHYHRQFGTAHGLRVSWNVLYVRLQLP